MKGGGLNEEKIIQEKNSNLPDDVAHAFIGCV